MVAPVNADASVVFAPNVVLHGNVYMRLRHLAANQSTTTVFRAQFYTGFVKLFKLDFGARDLDTARALGDVTVACTFAPAEPTDLADDAYEGLIMKESSVLWSEVLKRKEDRMTNTHPSDAFVVGTSRSSKRLSADAKKSVDGSNHDYVNEISKLENELKQMEIDGTEPEERPEETIPLGEGVDIDSILENYTAEMGVNVEDFDLKDYEDVLDEKEEPAKENPVEWTVCWTCFVSCIRSVRKEYHWEKKHAFGVVKRVLLGE